MSCADCKANKTPEMIPYIAHESDMTRMERTVKRQWITILVLIVLFVGTVCGWMYERSQYETVTTTTTYESDASSGGIAVANGDGSVNVNGES